jgi:hypothetical protein
MRHWEVRIRKGTLSTTGQEELRAVLQKSSRARTLTVQGPAMRTFRRGHGSRQVSTQTYVRSSTEEGAKNFLMSCLAFLVAGIGRLRRSSRATGTPISLLRLPLELVGKFSPLHHLSFFQFLAFSFPFGPRHLSIPRGPLLIPFRRSFRLPSFGHSHPLATHLGPFDPNQLLAHPFQQLHLFAIAD